MQLARFRISKGPSAPCSADRALPDRGRGMPAAAPLVAAPPRRARRRFAALLAGALLLAAVLGRPAQGFGAALLTCARRGACNRDFHHHQVRGSLVDLCGLDVNTEAAVSSLLRWAPEKAFGRGHAVVNRR